MAIPVFDETLGYCPDCGNADWYVCIEGNKKRAIKCMGCGIEFSSYDEFLEYKKQANTVPDLLAKTFHVPEETKNTRKTIFNYICDDWKRVKNHCRTTVNKSFTDIEPSDSFKKKLLISEHTPIRLLEIDWSWHDIKSWVSVHWTRHKHEKFVSTQRDDRKEHTISRDDMPQGTFVDMDNYANMQQLIDIFRKRLCYQASPETRELAEDFKVSLHEKHPEMANVLVPNCIYRNGCPEFEMCKERFFLKFLDYAEDKEDGNPCSALISIQNRYDLYNKMFYEEKNVCMDC